MRLRALELSRRLSLDLNTELAVVDAAATAADLQVNAAGPQHTTAVTPPPAAAVTEAAPRRRSNRRSRSGVAVTAPAVAVTGAAATVTEAPAVSGVGSAGAGAGSDEAAWINTAASCVRTQRHVVRHHAAPASQSVASAAVVSFSVDAVLAGDRSGARPGDGERTQGAREILSELLIRSALDGDIAVVKRLVSCQYVDVDVADRCGNTALHCAAVSYFLSSNRTQKCADTIGTVLVPWAGNFQC